MSKKRTPKQKEFDLLLKYGNDSYELTKRVSTNEVELIRGLKDKLDWRKIAWRNSLTDEFIDEFYDYISPYFEKITVGPNMPKSFLEINKEHIDWYTFILKSNGKRFTVDFIKQFNTYLKPYYRYILRRPALPIESKEYILNNNDDNIEWLKSFSSNPNITVKDLEKFKDKLDWKKVSYYAKCLSNERNFNLFKDKIDMYSFTNLSNMYYGYYKERFQFVLTENFLLEHKDENINWKSLLSFYNNYHNLKIPRNFFKDHYNELPIKAKNSYDEYKFKLENELEKSSYTYMNNGWL